MQVDLSNSHILIVDDSPVNVKILQKSLEGFYRLGVAVDGEGALRYIEKNLPDLILLDVMMPGMDGFEVCTRLKMMEQTKHIPIILITALTAIDDKDKGFSVGAVDYIAKPFEIREVRARISTHLELKLYRDNLEQQVNEKTRQLREANAKIGKSCIEAIYRLTLATEYKDRETGQHIKRISYYTKELAEKLGMDAQFIDTIFHAAPMHDIGKVSIPDSILLKQGKLDQAEWEIMKSHTIIGAKILEASDSPYLQMAREIAFFHHERWDGGGYPVGIARENIPLPARIMNIVDQYDALRSERPYKPSFDHEKVMAIITKGDGRTMPDHFDPKVLAAFTTIAAKFNEIFTSLRHGNP